MASVLEIGVRQVIRSEWPPSKAGFCRGDWASAAKENREIAFEEAKAICWLFDGSRVKVLNLLQPAVAYSSIMD